MPAFTELCLQQLRRALSALLPCVCGLCRRPGPQLLCAACRAGHFGRYAARCRQCALPLPPDAAAALCGDCLQNPPAFGRTVAACDYAAPQDQLVLALKFGHSLALAPLMADLLRDAILRQQLLQQSQLPDLLCVVPLGPHRLAQRGFNQALEIARPLSGHLGIELLPTLLQRSRETAQQSSLHPDARLRNVRQAFTLEAGAAGRVSGLHIGVVDDVMTTGATLHEIATMLKRYGAAQVSNYVFARTPPHSS